MKPNLFYLHTLSALHCGTGQSAGVIDLPIARDRASNLPLVPGSSLRGVLRDEFAWKDGEEEKLLEKVLFGPRSIGGADEAFAGALAVGDAHLLLLPIRALAGIVAYATCPFILKRFAKEVGIGHIAAIPEPKDDQAIHCTDNVNRLSGKIVLEDLDLNSSVNDDASIWAQHIAKAVFKDDLQAQADLTQRFLILPDTVFAFLAETATEIRARIAIEPQTGTVKKGALWYEENLPAETILWGIYAVSDSRIKGSVSKAEELSSQIPLKLLLQLGGKAGVGRGLTQFINGGAK
jgi:CRISPR-associated protein Cmr4